MLDVIVIGSGPAGLSAAVYAKRAEKTVLVIEKEYEGTGQIAESSRVDNYLGLYGIGGYELGEKFREHALQMEVAFCEGEVTKICQQKDQTWSVELEDGTEHTARTLIYAAGAKRKKLGIAGEDAFVGKGVSYCAICDGAFYQNKTVAVLGGGDTALDDALYLSDICEKVYLIHRRDQFRGTESTVTRVQNRENIDMILPARAEAVLGKEKVEALQLCVQEGQEEKIREVKVDGVFIAIGSVPESDLLKGFVSMDPSGYVIADEMGRTGREGLFVAGDVRKKELRQVVTAVADGANAATAAILCVTVQK